MTGQANHHTEYRHCHWGGAIYLTIEGVLWLLSAGLGAANKLNAAMIVLLMGGMFIHPLAMAISRLLKRPVPNNSNRLPILNTWIALTIPLSLPLLFMAISSGNQNLFFPAFTVLVGAHWLPFAYIYSMKSFLALSGLLVLAGTLFGFIFIRDFALCGFIAGSIHLFFAVIHFTLVRREQLNKNS